MPVFNTFVQFEPKSTLLWLNKSTVRETWSSITKASEPITHSFLDGLPKQHVTGKIRATLVAFDILPPRDEQLRRFELWLAQIVEELRFRDDKVIVLQYANWCLLSRFREGAPMRVSQDRNFRRQIRYTIQFLNYLAELDVRLGDAEQHILDYFLANQDVPRWHIGSFINWSRKHGVSHLSVVYGKYYPKFEIFEDPDERIRQVSRLLEDEEITNRDKFIALLILIYGLPLSRLVLLKRSDLTVNEDRVQLLVGRRPLTLAKPVAMIAAMYVSDALSKVVRSTADDWLFPGQFVGNHLSASYANTRMRACGVSVRTAKQTAILDLAVLLNETVNAELLGYSIETTGRWAEIAGAPQHSYAAVLVEKPPS